MKKTIVLLSLLFIASPVWALQTTFDGKPVYYPGSNQQNGGQVKIRDSYGSVNGYVKPVDGGYYNQYDKFHQNTGTYRINSDGSVTQMKNTRY